MLNRNKRLLLILVVLFVLFFSLPPAFAARANLDEIGIKLKALGLLIGDPDGNMRFQDQISRAEFAAVAARLIGKEAHALNRKGPTIFKDVPKDHWATGHINITVENKLFVGYDDGTFKLTNPISYGEVLTVLVNALGYGGEVPPENWPENFVSKASGLGITKDMTFDNRSPVTRGDMARMLNNSLSVVVKK